MLPFYFPHTYPAPMTAYEIRERLIEISQPDVATLKLINLKEEESWLNNLNNL